MPTWPGIVEALHGLASEVERAKVAKRVPLEQAIGVRMRDVFELAKVHRDLPIDEVEALLDQPHYESRMVAVSVLDQRARAPRATDDERRALYDLYLRRHDRIDTWDLVDRAAPRVVGLYLLDRPRDPLFGLAASDDVWRRRTAIVASYWLIREGDLDDPLAIAALLLDDEHLIQTAVGTGLREVGKIDPARRDAFLAEHADRVTPTTRRLAVR